MTTTEDLLSQDVGPLERNHMKNMVHRNALEGVAYGRMAKHLETQRKAFVRQNTRDEGEMRTLLCRLQNEQQQSVLEDENSDSDDAVTMTTFEHPDQEEDVEKHSQSANPYPVTILPKFPANPPKRTGSKKGIAIPESSRSTARNIPTDHEEMQDSLSAMTISQMSPPVGSFTSSQSGSGISTSRDEILGDWLASPDAISSVRRPRKTVSEQATRKNLIRTNSELLSQDSSSVTSFPASPRLRSNSMKDRRKHTSGKDTTSQSRRGGSMKERKNTTEDCTEARRKPLRRSYSMLTRAALAEFNQKQEMKACKNVLDSIDSAERFSEKTHGNSVKKV